MTARLPHELEAIAERARGAIRDSRIRSAALGAIDERALLLLLAVPGLQVLAVALGRAVGLGIGRLPWGLLVAGTLVPPLVHVFWHAYRAAVRGISDLEALQAVDDQLGLEDRLVSAAEFLAARERSPFIEAALEDAARFTEVARSAVIVREEAPFHMGVRARALLLLAIAAFIVAVGIVPVERLIPESLAGTTGGREVAEFEPRGADESGDREVADRTVAEEPEKPAGESGKPADRATAEPGEQSGELTREAKKTRGKTGAGRSANAASASGSSEAKGMPSNQGQSSLSSQKKSPKKSKKKPKPRDDDSEADRRRKPEDDSGATAGRGAASGSNKSPSASQWSSKDQVVSDDEEDLEDDEPVEDEFDDSDTRGGLQPGLRDRKPPVNRDLSIGFGNQKNPDANGRGGASEQKKSRGVASLVLGVPIPDHVKGRPNPGKTKITQERVEPLEEETSPVAGESRRRRQTPVGHLTRHDLLPWMRQLLEGYFMTLRNAEERSHSRGQE